MWHEVFLLILINSTRLDVVLMHVSALKSTFVLLTLAFHGPITLIVTSSQGAGTAFIAQLVLLTMLTLELVNYVSEHRMLIMML